MTKIINNGAGIGAIAFLLGMWLLGSQIRKGIAHYADKDRCVTVKGLSEKEVNADKVTWPIQTKELGNDLPQLYNKINQTTAAITAFLKQNGVKADEISVNAPIVIDLNAERYGENNRGYRYNITSTITVVSHKVDMVRGLIARQGELLQQGIAIVDGGYEAPIRYEFVSFKEMKPQMMKEAIENAELTAKQFAEASHSELDKITRADQGVFSIENRDENTPYIKKVRVVSTVTYSLKK